MLRLSKINVTLSPNTPLAQHVLKDLNLNLSLGEFVVIVGGNGCGKSTLLQTIAGHILPDSGSIIINNQNVTQQTRMRLADVSLVMQDPRLGTIANMTVAQNLNLGFMRGSIRGLALYNTRRRRDYFKQKLKILNMGLENRLDDLVANLSGGQRQALSLIMAIIANYKILLLDEITAALDPTMAENIMQIAARAIESEKCCAIMITHNMSHALRYGTRTLLMQDGKIAREYNMVAKNDMCPITLAKALNGEV